MPKMESAIAKPASFSSTSIVLNRTIDASRSASSPAWATRLGAIPAASLGPTIAATNMVTDIGNRRLPVSKASKPSTTCR